MGALFVSVITSADNEKLKTIRKLQQKRWRAKLGLFSAEGEDLVGPDPVFILRAGLFVRRDEVDLERDAGVGADLPVADRENAQFQIAQDFLKAGMLDRAEAAFEAVRETRFAIPAMRALIRIYESEHDWPRAIEAVRRLRALVDEPVPQLVHYQCEQAEGALQGKQPDFERAAKALDEADNAIRKLGTGQGMYASQARVAGLRARVARMQGQSEQERAYLVSILSSAPEYVGLYATELLDWIV